MFQSSRNKAERALSWKPKQLQFVDAWKYDNTHTATSWSFRHGSLDSAQIRDWLYCQESFNRPTAPESAGTMQGSIRLLFCEYVPFNDASMGMTLEDFRLVESMFKLHPATLPTLQIRAGTFSRFLRRDPETESRMISIILKAPQKYEICNYMLSLTHDFLSRTTTAILVGEDIIDTKALPYTNSHLHGRHGFPATTISEFISQTVHLWHHPLLLPCALGTDHLQKLQSFYEGTLTNSVMGIEEQLGVTRVGRRRLKAPALSQTSGSNTPLMFAAMAGNKTTGEPMDPLQAMDLTININTQFTKVHFTLYSPTWNCEVSQFLLKALSEVEGLLGEGILGDEEIADLLRYNTNVAKSIEGAVKGLQTRLNLQLNVLYSFIAQTDNRLNARLAATNGRDSTSMKILALITTIFLPGTFVATLFSMSMFDWQDDSSNSSGNSTVSSKFWVYWAVAIPLTIITISGWALWWSFEKRRYDVHVAGSTKSARQVYKPWHQA